MAALRALVDVVTTSVTVTTPDAVTQTVTATTTPSTPPKTPPDGWQPVIGFNGGLAAFCVVLMFWFYKRMQDSTLISDLCGVPVTAVKKKLSTHHRSKAYPLPANSPPARVTVPQTYFSFASEFLARRTEFWLLYAQFIIATLFVAAISAL